MIVFNSSLFLALQYKNGQKVGLLDPTSTRRVCGWGFIEGEPSKGVYRDSVLPHDVVSVKVTKPIDLEVLLPFPIVASRTAGQSAMKELGDAHGKVVIWPIRMLNVCR